MIKPIVENTLCFMLGAFMCAGTVFAALGIDPTVSYTTDQSCRDGKVLLGTCQRR